MTNSEQREATRQFIMKWRGHGNEKQESQSYWIDLLNVLGIDKATDYVQFERPVTVNGQQKYIDAYLPSVRVMVEMKSVDKDLAKPEPQSGGIIRTQTKELRRKVDHVAFLLTAKADEILIDLHARSPVLVERTSHHAVPADFVSVMLSSLVGADLFLDLGIDPQSITFFLFGNEKSACLHR